MRKVFSAAMLCFALLCFSGCDVNKMSSLSDLSKPYVGVYECKTLTLGGRDLSGHYDKLYLTLKYDGEYTLVWRGVNGEEGKTAGKYLADGDAEEITLYAYSRHRALSYTFPMKKGVIAIRYNFGGRLLNAEFSMP